MKNELRSSMSTQGRRMAGARALWVANGMKKEMMGKPIIAIVNSFTQFVPGHTHLHEIGQQVKQEIEKLGCFAAEFNTIAIDDGIAMGHDGMLYSLPSRDIIADSVEYMVNAHKADAMVCISNCDKITPGMLMASMRLNIPTVFVSGGPMEAGEWGGQHLDLGAARPAVGVSRAVAAEYPAAVAARPAEHVDFLRFVLRERKSGFAVRLLVFEQDYALFRHLAAQLIGKLQSLLDVLALVRDARAVKDFGYQIAEMCRYYVSREHGGENKPHNGETYRSDHCFFHPCLLLLIWRPARAVPAAKGNDAVRLRTTPSF